MTDTTDKLVEQIKADREAGTHEVCPFCGRDPYERVDVGVGSVPVAVTCCEPGISLHEGDDGLTSLICKHEEYKDRILSDAETIKAARELALVAMNTGCATQEDADRLAVAVAALELTLEKSHG